LVVVVVVVVVVVSADFAVVSIGAAAGAVVLRAVVSTAAGVASPEGLLLQAVRTTIEVTTKAKNNFFISLIFV
jgi:hypothetical protein